MMARRSRAETGSQIPSWETTTPSQTHLKEDNKMTYYCVTFIARGRIEQRCFQAEDLKTARQRAWKIVKAAGGNPNEISVSKW